MTSESLDSEDGFRIACCSYTINTFTPHAILKLVTKFYCSVINVIRVACEGSSCANFFPLFRSSSIFLFLRSHINSRCKGKIRCCFTRRVVFPYLASHANVCSHTSSCLPVKHNTSFSCSLLRTTVDCCFYTLSISSSTTVTLNIAVILFQAKGFEMAILFEVPS